MRGPFAGGGGAGSGRGGRMLGRARVLGAQRSSTPLSDQGGGVYIAAVPFPGTGATAFMVELLYNVGGASIPFTTEIRVLGAVQPVPVASRGGLVLFAAGLLLTTAALLYRSRRPVGL